MACQAVRHQLAYDSNVNANVCSDCGEHFLLRNAEGIPDPSIQVEGTYYAHDGQLTSWVVVSQECLDGAINCLDVVPEEEEENID